MCHPIDKGSKPERNSLEKTCTYNSICDLSQISATRPALRRVGTESERRQQVGMCSALGPQTMRDLSMERKRMSERENE